MLTIATAPELGVELGSAAGDIDRVHAVKGSCHQLNAALRRGVVHHLLPQGRALHVTVTAGLHVARCRHVWRSWGKRVCNGTVCIRPLVLCPALSHECMCVRCKRIHRRRDPYRMTGLFVGYNFWCLGYF